jgi:hypothetical protein
MKKRFELAGSAPSAMGVFVLIGVFVLLEKGLQQFPLFYA